MSQRPNFAESTEVDFTVKEETWNTYRLEDGTELKVKTILAGVIRSKDKYDPLGNPLYMIKAQNVIRLINVPTELKRKPKPNETPTV